MRGIELKKRPAEKSYLTRNVRHARWSPPALRRNAPRLESVALAALCRQRENKILFVGLRGVVPPCGRIYTQVRVKRATLFLKQGHAVNPSFRT